MPSFDPIKGVKLEKLPPVMITSKNDLTNGFNFIVTLNAFTYGFQEVSGIQVKREFDQINEGGVAYPIPVLKPTDTTGELTFKRGMLMKAPQIVSNALRAAACEIPIQLARKTALIAAASIDPLDALENGPAIGTISVFSRRNQLKALYGFLSLGMTEWQLDSLSASSGDILCETFTIKHTGLTRMPVSLAAGPTQAIVNLLSDDNREARLAALREQNAERMKKIKQQNEKARAEQEARYAAAEEAKKEHAEKVANSKAHEDLKTQTDAAKQTLNAIKEQEKALSNMVK